MVVNVMKTQSVALARVLRGKETAGNNCLAFTVCGPGQLVLKAAACVGFRGVSMQYLERLYEELGIDPSARRPAREGPLVERLIRHFSLMPATKR